MAIRAIPAILATARGTVRGGRGMAGAPRIAARSAPHGISRRSPPPASSVRSEKGVREGRGGPFSDRPGLFSDALPCPGLAARGAPAAGGGGC